MEQEHRRLGGPAVQAEDRMGNPLVRKGLLEAFNPILTRRALFSRVWCTHPELGGPTADLQEQQERGNGLEEWAVKGCHKEFLL